MRRKHKEPIPAIARRLLRTKLTIFAIVLVLAGVVLIDVSYHYQDIVINRNVQTLEANLTQDQVSSVMFNQPNNVSETVSFQIPSGEQVHYQLYKYSTYVDRITFQYVKSYTLIKEGDAMDGNVIDISPVYAPSQQYVLNLTSSSGNTFTVNLEVAYNITLQEQASRYIGGPGIILTVLGAVLLAYVITKSFEERERMAFRS